MANERDKTVPAGQQKLHQVRNPTTGETREITQEQWKNRRSDPALDGFERVDAPEGSDDETAPQPPQA